MQSRITREVGVGIAAPESALPSESREVGRGVPEPALQLFKSHLLISVMREAMPSLEVNGVTLFYVEKGAGEPVIFVHGIPTDYRAWDSQIDSLSEHFRAISYSRRYAYPNTRNGDLRDSTVENNAIDLMGLLEKLRVTPAHIVGHSYGGFISLYVAAHHPDFVRSLVLVEPAVSTILVKNSKSVFEFLLLLLRSPSVALSAARYVRKGNNPAFKALDRGDLLTALKHNLDAIEDKDGVLDKLSPKTRAMMIDNAKTVGELRTRFPVFTRDDAKRVRTPSLLISGESSALVLRRIADILADSIPNAEKARILGAGHFPHLDKAEEFNARVVGFLQRHSWGERTLNLGAASTASTGGRASLSSYLELPNDFIGLRNGHESVTDVGSRT